MAKAKDPQGQQPEPPITAEQRQKETEDRVHRLEVDARVHGLVHMFVSSKTKIRIKGNMDLEISIDDKGNEEE